MAKRFTLVISTSNKEAYRSVSIIAPLKSYVQASDSYTIASKDYPTFKQALREGMDSYFNLGQLTGLKKHFIPISIKIVDYSNQKTVLTIY